MKEFKILIEDTFCNIIENIQYYKHNDYEIGDCELRKIMYQITNSYRAILIDEKGCVIRVVYK